MEDQIGVSEPRLPGEPPGELCKIYSALGSHSYQIDPPGWGWNPGVYKKKNTQGATRGPLKSGQLEILRPEQGGS